jgi:phosphoribosylformylglycinamidine cyclo-ligase
VAGRGDAYATAGVDTTQAGHALDALITVLRTIDPGRPRSSIVGAGHYASVLALDERTGIALCTDGVGTKLIVAEQAGRFDTIGIDCVAMNVNDLICVGAEPLAMVDYLAVEQADAEVLGAIGRGLRRVPRRPGSRSPAVSSRSCRRWCAGIRRRAGSTSSAPRSAPCRSTVS